MAILSIENLSKNYGRIQALKSVSFTVPEGTVFGILGPNGSGKTTLLGIVMDVLKQTSGAFRLFEEMPAESHRRQIGTLLETPNFYHYLSGELNLKISASIKQCDKVDISRVLDIVNLTERRHSKFSTYSLGMKQRLAIAACLLGNPAVLVFDEPTNGLDPEGIAEIRELIKKLNTGGKTIIMASHLLGEVEKVCTHVAVLKRGVLMASGNVNEILATEDTAEVGAADMISLRNVLQHLNNYSSLKNSGKYFQLFYRAGEVNLEEINRLCFDNGVVLNHLQLKKKSLEEKFFELTNN